MKVNWTKEQQDAINSRQGSILVSAAAGSGKTAVLVQRVIQRLLDSENPTSADRLLIVTFTRAAASEMRQRISKALEEKIKQDPTNINLIKQQILLPNAKICTIDSFCNSLVKENFELLEIPADFKNADEGELKIIEKKAIDETMMRMYEKDDAVFLELVEFFFKGRDDSYLQEIIKQLHTSSMSFAFSEKWLEDLIVPFKNERDISTSRYGKIILEYVQFGLQYCTSLVSDMSKLICSDKIIAKSYAKQFESLMCQVDILVECLKQNEWDALKMNIKNFNLPRRGAIKSDVFDVAPIDKKRDEVKKIITKKFAPLFCTTKEEYRDDMEFFTPLVEKLVECTKLYSKIFLELKFEKKLVDFSDITKKALELLVIRDGEGYQPTALAQKLKQSFDEILIDEYQDTNKAQNMIFESISNNNLFRVGDVKQSIYRFRQAMPEIFINLKQEYPPYDREKDEYPAKIILGANFRSRKEVTDNINFLFSQTMSETVGDIEYDNDEKLNPLGAYQDSYDNKVQLSLIDLEELKEVESDFSKDEIEAVHLAHKILDIVQNQSIKLKDGDGERNARYSDICILLRSLSGGRAATYAKVFRKLNIPAYVEFKSEFFTSVEIMIALNLLRVIDNPKQDLALLSIMNSPVFEFTNDDLAKIKVNRRKGSFHSSVVAYSKSEVHDEVLFEKVKNLLDTLSRWRSLSVCLNAGALIEQIYEETSLLSIADAMDSEGIKKGNLQLLISYAKTYEAQGYVGLSGFIRFIDRFSQSKNDLPSALGSIENSNVVKIMSIHKSKGLEFPICMLANCSGSFNKMDEKKDVIISLKHGLGLNRKNTKTFEKFDTVCHNAMKISQSLESMSEELRVLYVAMTRAKEYLFMSACVKSVIYQTEKAIPKINVKSKQMLPFTASCASSYFDWIFPCFLRHQDSQFFLNEFKLDYNFSINCESSFEIEQVDMLEYLKSYCESDMVIPNDVESSHDNQSKELFAHKLRERLDFSYKYDKLSALTSKRAASEQGDSAIDTEYFASSKPTFMNEQGMTGAQRGIATHKFVQYADFEKGKQDVDGEIKRLIDGGFILEHEAKGINKVAAKKFFNGDLARRILQSEQVFREKQFTIEVPVGEIDETLAEFADEKIMIQGIADCAFVEDGELVIVDYKTDRVDDEDELVEKYRAQVDTYAKALNICTGYKIKQTLLYSFYLGKEVLVLDE